MRTAVTAIRSLFLVHLLCAAASAAPINPNDPPEGLFSDEWFDLSLGGKKVGYVHGTMSRDGEIIRTKLGMKMRFGRADKPVELSQSQSTTETLLGKVLQFHSVTSMAANETVMKGVVKGGKITITSTQFGFDRVSTFAFPTGAVMSWGAYRESIQHGFEPGTEYTIKMYIPDMRVDDAIVGEVKIGHSEKFRHKGRMLEGLRVTQILKIPAGDLEMLSWVDSDGNVIRLILPMPGMGNLELVVSDQQSALSDFVAPELMMTSTIKVKEPIDTGTVRRIKYRLRIEGNTDGLNDIPVTGMQTPKSLPDGSVELLVRRQKLGSSSDSNSEQSTEDTSEYVDGNLMINTDDPELRKLADKAAGGVTEPFALAGRLRTFVRDYIRDKSLNIGFATASEVCRNREGDCSEHGVLLAALGRIKGLPSRVAVGVAYAPFFGGQRDIFVYHLWTQFLIDGQWYDFDAALGGSPCSPARIAFAVSSLKNVGLVDVSLPLLKKIGAVKLEILEIE